MIIVFCRTFSVWIVLRRNPACALHSVHTDHSDNLIKNAARANDWTSPSGEVSSHILQSALKMNVHDQIHASFERIMAMVVEGEKRAAHMDASSNLMETFSATNAADHLLFHIAVNL